MYLLVFGNSSRYILACHGVNGSCLSSAILDIYEVGGGGGGKKKKVRR